MFAQYIVNHHFQQLFLNLGRLYLKKLVTLLMLYRWLIRLPSLTQVLQPQLILVLAMIFLLFFFIAAESVRKIGQKRNELK